MSVRKENRYISQGIFGRSEGKKVFMEEQPESRSVCSCCTARKVPGGVPGWDWNWRQVRAGVERALCVPQHPAGTAAFDCLSGKE